MSLRFLITLILGFGASVSAGVLLGNGGNETGDPGVANAQKPEGYTAAIGPFLKQVLRVHDAQGEAVAKKLVKARKMRLKKSGKNTLIAVIVEPQKGNGAAGINAAQVRALGGTVDAVSPSFMRVFISIKNLRRLAKHTGIRIVRAPTQAQAVEGMGANVSESVTLTGADIAQTGGITGAGVKVAVVDLGFIGLTSAVAAGEIPADAVAVQGGTETTFSAIESGTPHGVGVSEHVMDMAPGVTLYCIKVDDELDLENAAIYIRNNGIQIANHSVGWVIASYYDDTGPINQIINDSHDNDGVFWAVAAGNDAKSHWTGTWTDVDGDGWYEFSTDDEEMLMTDGSGWIFLNWDQYDNPVTDIDLYVVNKRGQLVAGSEDEQSGQPGQVPAEALGFSGNAGGAPYSIKIKWYSPSSPPPADLSLTIFSFAHNFTEDSVAASSMMDPADAHGAFTVAAIDQADWNLPSPPPEYFSSQGPTTDGRQKPDIAAPDGTTSLTYGFQSSYGTSFSSPTTAGAAALVLAQNPLFSPSQIATSLRNAGTDIGDTGADYVFGYGKLNVPIGSNNSPVADAGADQNVVDTDGNGTAQVTLDGSGSSDPDGTIVSYTWTEGVTSLGSGVSLVYAFAPGTHTVTLTVTDDGGEIATDDVVINSISRLVQTWGSNDYGQVGDGTNTQRLSPVTLSGLYGVRQIAGGRYHSLAVAADGTLRSWGRSRYGQLGDGGFTNSNQPVQVLGITDVTSVSGGLSFTVAAKSDGTAWGWGRNTFGQVGDGATTTRTVPVQVSSIAGVSLVAAGGLHAGALKSDGTIRTWGWNTQGQVGDGSTTTQTAPVSVSGSLSGVNGIAGGIFHTVISKTDGTVMAWGAGSDGQLGDGLSTSSLTPVSVSITNVQAVACGRIHTLALKNDGTVWAWGANVSGQLGDGSTASSASPVQVSGLTDVRAIAAGMDHSLALKTDGTVWTWGYNSNGQLGDGSTTNSSTPIQVSGLSNVVAIAGGGLHSMALYSSLDAEVSSGPLPDANPESLGDPEPDPEPDPDPVVNTPPVIESVWATFDGAVSVSVLATDDALPGPLSYSWSLVSGPGTVEFAINNSTESDTSEVTFSVAGLYTLRVTVSDGELSVTKDLDVGVSSDSGVPPQLVVTAANPIEIAEGANGTFTVALSDAPAAAVTVTVAHLRGDKDLTVSGGGTFIFTARNWNTPQTVTLAAADDRDRANGRAVFAVTAPEMKAVQVNVRELDSRRRLNR